MIEKSKSKKVEILFGDEEDEYLEEDNYFKIDAKNTFSIGDAEESKDKLYKILNDNDDFIIENYELQKRILSLFYEKIYKTDNDPFNICHNLSKQLTKSLGINKNVIDGKLDYFVDKKNIDYKYKKLFEFNKENINNLGHILAYSYNKFSSFRINNSKDLKANVEKTKEEKMDALTLFYAYYFENQNSKEKLSKTMFWKKNRSKFHLPGTFIFLMNIFIYVKNIEINLNFEEEKLTKDDVNLFILCILNIQYIFPMKINIKINLIHEELQCFVYRRFYKELFLNTKRGNFKMIYMNKNDLYRKKWDFETEFLLEKHRKNKKEKIEKIFNSETLIDENYTLNDVSKTPNKEDSIIISHSNSNGNKLEMNSAKINMNVFKSMKNIKNISMFNYKDDPNKTINNFENNLNTSNISKGNSGGRSFISTKSISFINPNYKMINNPNENYQNLHYDNIIDKFKKSLGLILLTIDSLNKITNMKRLDLIINDCYKSELQSYLHSFCTTEANNKFHIVDILINKVRNLEDLNIEFNILDHITFNKILSFINYNLSMTSIKISFFSSDATYLRQTIYKIFYQNLSTGGKNTSISDIINMILPHFEENLEVLFELIKIKDLKKIAINFETPIIIEINNSYMNTIFKFVMNLLFLVDNPNTRIEKLTILSPSTKFDSRFLPSIDNILEDINFNENNKFLNELSLHLQLFMLKNIKNLISERLIQLNLGDCDEYSFRELTKFLTSLKFCRKSSLKKLSISLINSIIEYKKEIKINLYKIFSIRIKQLEQLNIYTNIYMTKEDYFNSFDIFKNNWISKCRLTLNEKTDIEENNLEIDKNNNIFYLVPHSLEDELLPNDELVIRNKIFNNTNDKNIIDRDKEDNIYWILKQIFNKKYNNFGNKIKIRSRKNIIFNTLKYLYFTKNVDIKHHLES
jgi:hypothetical protein